MALAYYRDEYDPREHGSKCEVCPLKRKRPVPPTYSSGKTKLILVGEAPGHHEEHHGAPFIGPSGLRMNAVLDDAKFRRSDCHITNAILCKPDDERTQLEDAIACCAPRLGQELEELPEEAPIVPLGASAAKSIIGTASILRTRGFIWHLPDVSDKLAEAKRKLTKLLDQEYEGDAKDPRLLREKILRQRQKIWALRTRQKIARRLALPTVHPAFVLRVEGWHPVRGRRQLPGGVDARRAALDAPTPRRDDRGRRRDQGRRGHDDGPQVRRYLRRRAHRRRLPLQARDGRGARRGFPRPRGRHAQRPSVRPDRARCPRHQASPTRRHAHRAPRVRLASARRP